MIANEFRFHLVWILRSLLPQPSTSANEVFACYGCGASYRVRDLASGANHCDNFIGCLALLSPLLTMVEDEPIYLVESTNPSCLFDMAAEPIIPS